VKDELRRIRNDAATIGGKKLNWIIESIADEKRLFYQENNDQWIIAL